MSDTFYVASGEESRTSVADGRGTDGCCPGHIHHDSRVGYGTRSNMVGQ